MTHSPCTHSLEVYAAVWLSAKETEIRPPYEPIHQGKDSQQGVKSYLSRQNQSQLKFGRTSVKA